jgi:RNA polymerase sigma factor (sigma-70 family)
LAALDELPEEQRMVFVLRHIRGLSIEETAAALDCPVNTVRSRRILALRKLRTLLAPYHDVPAAHGRTPEEARHAL